MVLDKTSKNIYNGNQLKDKTKIILPKINCLLLSK